MTDDDEFSWISQLRFAPSRIPKLDALATFVPLGQESEPVLTEVSMRTGFSRWFPVEGGHQVLYPFEGGTYDAARFSIKAEGWDHETCHVCRAHIPAMTLCWVSEDGPYIILCEQCHEERVTSS
jgi:hypothetical protein